MERTDLWALLKTLRSPQYKWVELSHPVSEKSPHFEGFPDMTREVVLNIPEHGASTELYGMVSQYGTHVDPPSHFVAGGRTLEKVGLDEMVFPLCVVDVSQKAAKDLDYALTVKDLQDWESKHGRIPEGAFVAMRTDWSKRPFNAFNGADAQGVNHNPGWSMEALEFLLNERQIGAIGHETADTDPASVVLEKGWFGELYYLKQDKIQVEMLTNLDQLPPTGAIIFCTFPCLIGGTGFTARCFAIAPK